MYNVLFCRYRKKVEQLRSKQDSKSPSEVKQMNEEHKEKHGTSREPLLNGIASDYDLDLFRRAQVGNFYNVV